MPIYRKKPVEVEAIQFTRTNWEEVKTFCGPYAHNFTIPRTPNGIATFGISTLEGVLTATQGDYIIKGVQGEFYPCKPAIFEATYELVGEA